MINQDKQSRYRVRYMKVMDDLTQISKMQPREKYMYRLMDTVIFQDFETALETVIEDFNVSNDNTHNSLP